MNSYDFIQKIDEMIEERSLLKHPFYQMWSDGKLTLDSLAGYSKEYYQLVKQVPRFMTPIIEDAPSEMVDELVSNQREEVEHIEPWKRFSESLGITKEELENYRGLPKTKRAINELSSLMTAYDSGACAMYSFEKELPKVSQTKLDGLAKFYGISSEDATEYFKLHTEADIRHAASWKKSLEGCDVDKQGKLLDVAKRSVEAQNLLLDSCYETYC